MSGSALISALTIGLAVGLAGRLLVPGRRVAPVWLTVALGVAAALLGSVVIRLLGADLAELTVLRLVAQSGFAGVAVVLAVVAAERQSRRDGYAPLFRTSAPAPPPSSAAGERREREDGL
ncbi:hypothetical protein [Micromonospora sp. NPDC047738]|uniref:GlsB/YeaQ/YmgE family stress response membrane protein n=1 Tax=unclassified Micromonospora TaxID=2617518 RepID=UPI00340669DA